jgi:hypothetical protein
MPRPFTRPCAAILTLALALLLGTPPLSFAYARSGHQAGHIEYQAPQSQSFHSGSDPPVFPSLLDDPLHPSFDDLLPPPLGLTLDPSLAPPPPWPGALNHPEAGSLPLPGLVEDSDPPWMVAQPPGIDQSGKLSTSLEHGRLRLSMNTGISRDPMDPESLALESYLLRLTLGQQALAVGDLAVQETGLWRPISSRGLQGSMDAAGLRGGMFLVKNPTSETWDDPMTGGMLEKRLFGGDIQLRAMAALREEAMVSGMGLSAPLLGDSFRVRGELFWSDAGSSLGDSFLVQGHGTHAGFTYTLGYQQYGPSYSNPFRPEQLGGHEETTLNVTRLLPFIGDHKITTSYGLRLREGPESGFLMHSGRTGLTLGRERWLFTPAYTVSLVEPLLGEAGKVEQHGLSLAARLVPWPGVNLSPEFSYTHRISDPMVLETWQTGLRSSLPLHQGAELQVAIERSESRADGSFLREQWSLWSRYALSPNGQGKDRRKWTLALENRFSRHSSLSENVDETAVSIRLDIPAS